MSYLDLLERVRTQTKAWERVVSLAVEKSAGSLIEELSIIHVCAPEGAKKLEETLRAYLPCPDKILFTELTPGLSVHSGSGMVGACFVVGQ